MKAALTPAAAAMNPPLLFDAALKAVVDALTRDAVDQKKKRDGEIL